MKNNRPIYVAWNDSERSKRITFWDNSLDEVRIIAAVPKYKSGDLVGNYHTAFESRLESMKEDKLSIILENTPVYVESIVNR